MAKSNVTMILNASPDEIWAIITSMDNYAWRSDISKIEVIESGKKFVEYTAEGYPTTFTITAFEPCTQYEFDMENTKMHGHWIGKLKRMETGTMVDFTEDVIAENILLKPFVKIYLKKQQMKYFSDLKRALGE
jgi:hypothetical protein